MEHTLKNDGCAGSYSIQKEGERRNENVALGLDTSGNGSGSHRNRSALISGCFAVSVLGTGDRTLLALRITKSCAAIPGESRTGARVSFGLSLQIWSIAGQIQLSAARLKLTQSVVFAVISAPTRARARHANFDSCKGLVYEHEGVGTDLTGGAVAVFVANGGALRINLPANGRLTITHSNFLAGATRSARSFLLFVGQNARQRQSATHIVGPADLAGRTIAVFAARSVAHFGLKAF